jgi:acetoacetyl-CoA synthetase
MNDGMLLDACVRPPIGPSLAPLFAQVLGVASVGDADDFFDMGGDSILAAALMLEIERVTGRPMAMTALYDAPTPAAMARMIAAAHANEAPAEASRLVQLRAGDLPALFMPHGLLGIVTDLIDLSQRLDTTQAVYGIQAIGGPTTATPPARIEEMARTYIDDIRRVQPQGPYLLGGYCFGGLIALEMAQQLRARGEDVALLTLLDTHPHSKHWPLHYRALKWVRLLRSQLSGQTVRNMLAYIGQKTSGMSPRERAAYLVTRLGRGLLVPFSLFRLSVMLHRFELADGSAARPRAVHPPAIQRMADINVAAFKEYRPRRYDGKVVLLQTLARKRVQFDGRAVWSGLIKRLKIGTVPAYDWETVGALVAYFAVPLSQWLRTDGAAQSADAS